MPAVRASSTNLGASRAAAGASARSASKASTPPRPITAPTTDPETNSAAILERACPRGSAIDGSLEVALRLLPGGLPARGSEPPAVRVVGRDVDPAVQARDASLIRGGVVG